jgi:hypothetical protein
MKQELNDAQMNLLIEGFGLSLSKSFADRVEFMKQWLTENLSFVSQKTRKALENLVNNNQFVTRFFDTRDNEFLKFVLNILVSDEFDSKQLEQMTKFPFNSVHELENVKVGEPHSKFVDKNEFNRIANSSLSPENMKIVRLAYTKSAVSAYDGLKNSDVDTLLEMMNKGASYLNLKRALKAFRYQSETKVNQ